jgi:hypothetical protein
MAAIHQLYATHCTYGSSAIERRTAGDSRDRVLGYSARASSFSQSELRRHFRTIERYLYYYLPKDTPPEKKQTLTPQTAPHRFFFTPTLSGLQALGCVSYRQTDRAGRVGSYFGHLLVAQRDKGESAWDVLQCLQLWKSPGWVLEDSDACPHDLPSLDQLIGLHGGTAPAVDERLLWSFLNTPPGERFHAPGTLLLPERWTRMSVADRRRYFRLALMGYLQVSSNERESLLLLVEPSVSVLFFYGIARLLPPGLRAGISFSTFEANADRLATSMAAMTFDDERTGGDVPPDRYRRGFVLNTWQGRASELQDPQARYADFVLTSLVDVADSNATTLGQAIDQKLARFQAADAARASDLEEFVKAHDVAEAIVALKPNVSHEAWKKSPAQTAYVRKAVRQKLSGPADPAYLNRVLNSTQYLPLMLETALQGDEDDNCSPSLNYLVERVQPLDAVEALLGTGDGARRYKLHALRHYVKNHRRLPGACRWLWAEKRPPARGPQKPALLVELVQWSAIDPQLVRDSLDDVPDEGLPLLFRGLLKTSYDQTDRMDLLARIAARPGFDVVTLVNDLKPELTTYGALLGSILADPLTKLLDHVHEQPGRFGEIAAALDAAKSLLAAPAAARARGWLDLKATFEKYHRDPAAQQTGLKPVPGRKVWAFTEEVCKYLDRCFPFAEYEVFRKDYYKEFGTWVRQVAAAHQVGPLVPEQFDNYLVAFFRTDLHAMRRISNRGSFVWFQDYPYHAWGSVAVAILLLLGLVGMWINSQRMSTESGDQAPVAQGTSQAGGEPENKEPVPTPSPKEPRSPIPVGQPDATVPPTGTGNAEDGRPREPPAAAPASSSPAGQESGKMNAGDGEGQPPTAGGGLQPNDNPAAAQANDKPSTDPKTPPTASSETESKDAKPAKKSAVLKIDGQDLAADSNLPPYIIAQPAPPAPTEPGLLRAGLAGVPYTVRLHGADLISVAPSSSHGELGEFDRIDSQADAEALVVTAFFGAGLNPRRVPLARFFVAEGKLKWSLETPETQRKKDDVRTLLGALPYCVLQLQPQAEAPVVFHTFKGPKATRFRLPELGATVGSKEEPLDVPSDHRWKQCYLGAGKIIAADGEEYEFGATWGDEDARDKWPIPKLKQTLGLESEPTIELASQGELAKLVVKPAELKANEELRVKKAKRTEEKTNIERLLVKATRRTEDTTEAIRELAQAVGLGDRIPSVPIPPTPLTGNVKLEKMHNFDQAMQRYREQAQQHEEWRTSVIDKARTQATLLGQEIKEIVNPSNPDAGPVAEWLKKTKLEVEAHVYRVVPYDGPGPKREIRVLLVEPGDASPAKPEAEAVSE